MDLHVFPIPIPPPTSPSRMLIKKIFFSSVFDPNFYPKISFIHSFIQQMLRSIYYVPSTSSVGLTKLTGSRGTQTLTTLRAVAGWRKQTDANPKGTCHCLG